ncbi:PHP-associated domain-containing protein [[Eubacterium] cellulosolvens]
MNLKIDIHIHSINSFDGSIQIEDLPEMSRSKGLDGVAITDHDKFFDRKVEGLVVIPGIEVSTREGHLLGLGQVGEVPAGLSVDETIRIIHDRGGVAILAHPYDLIRGGIKPAQITEKLDGIETINSKAYPYNLSKHLAEKAAKRMKVSSLGGSDSHILETIGDAYTCIRSQSSSVDEIIDAIRKGDVSPKGGSTGNVNQLRRMKSAVKWRLKT